MKAAVAAKTRTRPASGSRSKKRRRHKGQGAWRRKALAVIAIVLALALLGVGLWIVYFSSALVTKRVNIVGTRQLTPTQVSFAVQVPLDVPLARQNLDEMAKRATTLPAIESATATRQWPNVITVTVVERYPVFAMHQPNGYVVVDKLGVAYQTQRTLPPDVVLAEIDRGDAALLREVATVAAALSDKLRGKVDCITATSRNNVVLVLKSGRQVTWGSAADSELKAQVVTALLKHKPKSSIDVSSPHNPAVS